MTDRIPIEKGVPTNLASNERDAERIAELQDKFDKERAVNVVLRSKIEDLEELISDISELTRRKI